MKHILSISLFSIVLLSCGSEISNVEKEASKQKNDLIEKIDSKKDSIINEKKDAELVTDSNEVNQIEKHLNQEVNKNTGEYISTSNKLEISTEEKKKAEKTIVETVQEESNAKMEEIKSSVVEEVIEEKPTEPTPIVKAEIHKTWDDLVKKYISSSGKVNYAGFKKEKTQIEKYIKELQSYNKDLTKWSKNKRLAYWINVYNAVTIKLIVDNYPVNSITDLHGGKPWDAKLITLGAKTYTLNDIENKIIRPTFKEGRIHFAVNCAAKSCPKIMNKAWTENNIQRYLTKQTKAFLANTTQNTISADKVVLSKIFEWYKADFGGNDTKLIEFINKYSTVKVNPNAAITYNEYNWSLNK